MTVVAEVFNNMHAGNMLTETCSWFESIESRVEVAEFLLQHGANADHQDDNVSLYFASR